MGAGAEQQRVDLLHDKMYLEYQKQTEQEATAIYMSSVGKLKENSLHVKEVLSGSYGSGGAQHIQELAAVSFHWWVC
ncbi:Interleukin-13 Receptor Subunit Alpha-1 [Manis pentadactyla]|nr:Interleukin-13 Receptor Subunit Alpha-1 [Manis pentadactyla]